MSNLKYHYGDGEKAGGGNIMQCTKKDIIQDRGQHYSFGSQILDFTATHLT